MAEDRYRLAPLRTVREHAEVGRRGELAEKIGDASVTQGQLAIAHARSESARAAVAAAVAGHVALQSSTQLELSDRFIARRRSELAHARAEEDRARLAHEHRQGEVDTARLSLARARADREVIERHFAKWRADKQRRADNAAD